MQAVVHQQNAPQTQAVRSRDSAGPDSRGLLAPQEMLGSGGGSYPKIETMQELRPDHNDQRPRDTNARGPEGGTVTEAKNPDVSGVWGWQRTEEAR
mmetsp:Transcript_41992/g.65631  ORF Transcript_41992/g.65631 Transcript_41992/m.65631 type:complete len:96 (+) Transcript_41992:2905-3192(+)